jgi:hypothetical protein
MAKNILRLDMDLNRTYGNIMEKWERWEPIKNLSSEYYLESILFDDDGLKIILSDEIDSTKKLNIVFDGVVASYKLTDETYKIETWAFLDKQYGKAFYSKWRFFRVFNSSYLKILSEDSCGIADSHELLHFVITGNEVLEVIVAYEPIVEIIESK